MEKPRSNVTPMSRPVLRLSNGAALSDLKSCRSRAGGVFALGKDVAEDSGQEVGKLVPNMDRLVPKGSLSVVEDGSPKIF